MEGNRIQTITVDIQVNLRTIMTRVLTTPLIHSQLFPPNRMSQSLNPFTYVQPPPLHKVQPTIKENPLIQAVIHLTSLLNHNHSLNQLKFNNLFTATNLLTPSFHLLIVNTNLHRVRTQFTNPMFITLIKKVV